MWQEGTAPTTRGPGEHIFAYVSEAMNHFEYRDGVLCAEDVPLPLIAAEVGTPVYVYSTATLRRHYKMFTAAFGDQPVTVCYAIKANSNLAIVKTLSEIGAGADVGSEGELRRALAANVPPQQIVFSGVGKTREEIAFALAAGILQFNIESEPEITVLSELASARGDEAQVGIRVNPDVDPDTHAKITTGLKENKFGIEVEQVPTIYAHAANLPGIRPVSLAVHIGSQVTNLAPFRTAFANIARLTEHLRSIGHEVRRLDLGGGLGIPYSDNVLPTPMEYARTVLETVGHLGCELVFEPGRVLVGNAGVLLTRVTYLKEGCQRRFAIVDAAMNDLMRPALYDAWHDALPVTQALPDARWAPIDLVGPVCETGDTFATERQMPPLAPGDLLSFSSAGAYGAVMASTYNSRRLVPEVLVRGADCAVVRPRQSYDSMLEQDVLPHWLENAPLRHRGVA